VGRIIMKNKTGKKVKKMFESPLRLKILPGSEEEIDGMFFQG